jgi:uncharacterized protein (DUF2147 family)
MIKSTLVACALMAQAVAFAQASPVGLWKTIDDKTKEAKSHVRIVEAAGLVSGKVEKLLDPARQDAKCTQCSEERKGQPVLGMLILRNMKPSTDDKAVWEGGDITDPDNGKTYRARLKTSDGGQQLEMRGYIGPFFRTQVWTRVE